MARFQNFVANVLCHEAVSFLIYGTVLLLLLFYIPYWIRQLLDRHFLKFLAKKARERFQQALELCQSSPGSEPVHSLLMKEEEDDETEKKTDMEMMPVSVNEVSSEEKVSLLSNHSSKPTN